MKQFKIVSNSFDETLSAGQRLGSLLKKTGKLLTIYLFGDLGSGKTVFIKGLASAFGISPRDIGSASFVIIAEYESLPRFYHVDLYRIEGEDTLESIGIWEYIDSDGVTAIEWADRLTEIPEGGVKVSLSIAGENIREIFIEGVDEKDWHNMQTRMD
jgi:tRNA threonylcarbamoyladenosine biosynthesis protein TsaE